MSTLSTIEPVLLDTYGSSSMVDALAADLAMRIDEDGIGEERITQICWMWFSGGSTAQGAAKRIVEALA